MIPQALIAEGKLLLRGILSALAVGALIGILHYFGVPVPQSLVLPTMALAGYGGVKVASINALA